MKSKMRREGTWVELPSFPNGLQLTSEYAYNQYFDVVNSTEYLDKLDSAYYLKIAQHIKHLHPNNVKYIFDNIGMYLAVLYDAVMDYFSVDDLNDKTASQGYKYMVSINLWCKHHNKPYVLPDVLSKRFQNEEAIILQYINTKLIALNKQRQLMADQAKILEDSYSHYAKNNLCNEIVIDDLNDDFFRSHDLAEATARAMIVSTPTDTNSRIYKNFVATLREKQKRVR